MKNITITVIVLFLLLFVLQIFKIIHIPYDAIVWLALASFSAQLLTVTERPSLVNIIKATAIPVLGTLLLYIFIRDINWLLKTFVSLCAFSIAIGCYTQSRQKVNGASIPAKE